MTEPDEQKPRDPVPVRPVFIDYRTPSANADFPNRMTRGQIATGFGCWVFALFCAVGAGMTFKSGWFSVTVLLGALVLSATSAAKRVGWRGIIPGILIGFALTCLLPVGILAVYCSNHPL